MKRVLTGAVLGAVLLSAAPADAQIGGLRRIGRIGAGAAAASLQIGVRKETEIGRGIAATVAGRYKVVRDTALIAYVDRVGQVVAEQSPRSGEIAFHFSVLDTDDVNAFASPGGFIFVTRGALALMESEAELAGVLAHEVAHVDERHVLDQIRKFDMLKNAQSEADLGGALADEILSQAAGVLFTGLGREDEDEADEVGVRYAAAAGYRADGLLTFVGRLAAAAGENEGRRRFLSELRTTHPPAAERITRMQQKMAEAGIDPAAGEVLAERFRRHVKRQ